MPIVLSGIAKHAGCPEDHALVASVPRQSEALKQPGDLIQDPILGLSTGSLAISHCEKSHAFVVAANRKSHAFTKSKD
ncbi:hypothetical protein D3C84_1159260 [compost metagenome]